MNILQISFHTSPFSSIGKFDSGGLNVYVQQISKHLSKTHNLTVVTAEKAENFKTDNLSFHSMQKCSFVLLESALANNFLQIVTPALPPWSSIVIIKSSCLSGEPQSGQIQNIRARIIASVNPHHRPGECPRLRFAHLLAPQERWSVERASSPSLPSSRYGKR